jgi:N-acetylneuraminic acid mutarotase
MFGGKLRILLILCVKLAVSLQAEWIQITSKQRVAPRRSGQAAFSLGNNHYIFGGYVEEDGDPMPKRRVTNDLWQWNEEGWNPVQHKGDIPRACLLSAAAAANDKAYLFGGWDPGTAGTGGDILEDVYEFDLATKEWTAIGKLPDGPTSRHVAIALDDRIVIHTHRCIDYVWIFNCNTKSFTKQATTGTKPSSRGLHAATRVADDTIVFFGGAAQNQIMSNEVFLLDTNKWDWSLSDTGDQESPCPRAGACLCTMNSNSVLVFGGAEATVAGLIPKGEVWHLCLKEKKWTMVLSDQDLPPARNAATMTRIASDEFLLTGGWHPFRQTFDDCFVLKIS